MIDVIVMVTWATIDPFYITTTETGRVEGLDVTTVYEIDRCESKHYLIFVGILVGLQGILLLLGWFSRFDMPTTHTYNTHVMIL